MVHAFLVTVYKDEAQVCSLITQLLKYNSRVYLHIDKKTGALQKKLEAKYSGSKNVFLLANPVRVYWGGFSHLEAILALLKAAYAETESSRFHLLSGQDLPIRSKTEFDHFFRTNAHKEYITCFKLPDAQWANGGLDRIQHFHLNDIFNPKKFIYPRINGRLLRLQKWLGIKRKQPACISSWYGGGTWWSLSRKAVDEIFNFQEKHPGFIRRFKHTYCPEEIFFQTILSHSPLKDSIMPEDLRYIDWNVPGGKFPPVLDESYLEKIFKNEKFFARKFDSAIPENLRARLEKVVDGE